MYYYNYQNCTSRYYPKLYLGTVQTIAQGWNSDGQNGTETTLPNWPNSYQSNTQKGEARKLLCKLNYHISIFVAIIFNKRKLKTFELIF